MANPPVPIDSATARAADAAARAHNALWYTFGGIGRAYLIQRGSFDAGAADVASVHGYATIEQAYANPNSVNAASQVTIQQWNNHASLPAGGGTLGTIETVNITAPTAPGGQPVISTPQDPATAAAGSALGSGWSLAFGNTAGLLGRILKVVIGGTVLIIGIAMIAGKQEQVGSAARSVAANTPVPGLGLVARGVARTAAAGRSAGASAAAKTRAGTLSSVARAAKG